MLDQSRPRLQVDWQEDAIRARGRESAFAALVLHVALLLVVLVQPGLLSGGAPAAVVVLPEDQKDLTVLYLPSDAVPVPEPQTPRDLTPEESRRAVVQPKIYLDREELERVLPPRQAVPLAEPEVALTEPGGPTGGEVKERATTEPLGGDPQSSRRTEIARLEDVPAPGGRDSRSLTLPERSAGRAIQESLRPAPGAPQGGAGTGGGPGGLPGAMQPNFSTPFPRILSDTRGVDFTPYLIRLVREVRRNWYAVIPESARWGEQGKVVIVFTVLKDGSVPMGQPQIIYSSGRSHLDRPTLAAIRASQPFPPLPAEFTGPNLALQFTFLYNLPIDYQGP
ncbi:MAG: TonB family protein [Candidatus Acidiferrales bacterium]